MYSFRCPLNGQKLDPGPVRQAWCEDSPLDAPDHMEAEDAHDCPAWVPVTDERAAWKRAYAFCLTPPHTQGWQDHGAY